MPAAGGAPSHEQLVKELEVIRRENLGSLRRLNLPALHTAAMTAGLRSTDEDPEPAAIEALVREAVTRFDGGDFQEAAEYTFGLIGGTKYESATQRRKHAAKSLNLTTETFRKSHEKVIIEQVAEGVLALTRDAAMRQANVQMQQRHPADSRLAVAWIERFEAYYRIWTPVYALAADLRAAHEMYGMEPADHLPWDPASEQAFDPVKEAQGYARSALYHYALFLLEMKRFMVRHGGLWLFADSQCESDIRDAIYEISWHNTINEENNSWLRRALATTQLEEAEPFYALLRASTQGENIHNIWQKFVLDGLPEGEQSQSTSQVEQTIAACEKYNDLVDAEWMKIADWYGPLAKPVRGISAADLFAARLNNLPLKETNAKPADP